MLPSLSTKEHLDASLVAQLLCALSTRHQQSEQDRVMSHHATLDSAGESVRLLMVCRRYHETVIDISAACTLVYVPDWLQIDEELRASIRCVSNGWLSSGRRLEYCDTCERPVWIRNARANMGVRRCRACSPNLMGPDAEKVSPTRMPAPPEARYIQLSQVRDLRRLDEIDDSDRAAAAQESAIKFMEDGQSDLW